MLFSTAFANCWKQGKLTSEAERAPSSIQRLEVEWLGRVEYAEGLRLQAEALEARRSGACADRLFLLEHPPVVTLGRSSHEENLLTGRDVLRARKIEVHEVARGGDVTYHGPGQLVGYLIMDLKARHEQDVHLVLRRLESALIVALADLGLHGERIQGKTGVFVQRTQRWQERDRKIASIGIGVRHWITLHGFALNVTMDLAGFESIVPCGLEGVEMTSVERELETRPDDLDERARRAVAKAMLREFSPEALHQERWKNSG